MLFFLFGDNITASRNKLNELLENHKSNGFEITRADSVSDLKDFELQIESESFFSEKKAILFENFFKGKTPKWKTEIDFKKLEIDENIYIFWEDGSENASIKKAITHAQRKNIFEFKFPNLLWNFLDGVAPFSSSVGTSRDLSLQIKTLRDILKSVDENYLFLMLFRQFRLLILSKEPYKDYPSEYKRLTFQKYKLAKQVALFSKEKLHEAYKNLLAIEERQKTGTAIYDLKTELEKFIINL